MFSSFFEGTQQDWKIMIVAPVICAVFRLAFIWVYAPDKGFNGCRKKWYECFRYGFWWGMDYNAYVFLISGWESVYRVPFLSVILKLATVCGLYSLRYMLPYFILLSWER